jgi:hypothetical protein
MSMKYQGNLKAELRSPKWEHRGPRQGLVFGFQIKNPRFAACARNRRLLLMEARTGSRSPASESSSHFILSAGCFFGDRPRSVSQQCDNMNLTRCEIFRGKVPPRET